ncbi:uncharacterized protein LOC127158113 [Labeo rohita]|uniref:uncharacterized protein LOC127158113 n=1 Tax=Labeo rohita TaxID=84645 RepID=UPI0021E1C42C|nr:uncharacterized protein LOC127158113 [Labeo rohita]
MKRLPPEWIHNMTPLEIEINVNNTREPVDTCLGGHITNSHLSDREFRNLLPGHVPEPNEYCLQSQILHCHPSPRGRPSVSALRREHRSEGGTRPSRSAYPMSTARFQRKVFSMLFVLKDELERKSAILDPGKSTSSFKRLDSESDLKSFEEYIKDDEKKWICVQQLSRVGGSSVRDCVKKKIMNGVMSNALMAKFNMRGGGQLDKKPFKATALYYVIQDML